MLHRVIAIGRWVIDFLFAPVRYDREAVFACLYELEAPRFILRRAWKIMEDDEPNKGFTYSNSRMRRAVVVIGPTTDSGEFLNTFTHELRHLADAIAKSIGYKLDSEGPAYLTGEAAMALATTICELGCPCHHNR